MPSSTGITNESLQALNMTQKFIDKTQDLVIEYTPKVITALIIYFIGKWIIRWVMKLIDKIFNARDFDPTLKTFLASIIKAGLILFLFITIANTLGLGMTSFTALLAGVGIAIGTALNGSLGNVAGGVMLMIFKPFRVGDIIEAQGITGKVTAIGIMSTMITTADNRTVYLPNGSLSTGVITNYNTQGSRIASIEMYIDGSNDIQKTRDIIINAIKDIPEIIPGTTPSANVTKIDNGATVFGIAAATKPSDYDKVRFQMNERVKYAFIENNIAFPLSTMKITNGAA